MNNQKRTKYMKYGAEMNIDNGGTIILYVN